MTTDKQQPAIDATVSGAVVNEAALFTIFYVDREDASLLYQRLRSLAQQTPEAFPSSAQNPNDEPLLQKMDLTATQDATAILLILNAPGDAASAWETMRRRLIEILYAPDLPIGWWGYTVIYQAVLNEGIDADLAFSKLLPEVRRPSSSENLQRPLAKADMSGGRLWMVDAPLQGNSPAAATVLVALSPPDEEEAFKRTLLGRMLMPDLIAHKAYSMMRVYRGELQQNYKSKLKDFWIASDELLSDLGGQIQKPGKLDEVARWYGSLANVVSKFNRMGISMAQQLHNFDRWRAQTEGNGIVEYHYGHLETAERELELLVAQGQDALGVADKALSMARVEVDRAQQSNQRVITLLLAVVSAALTTLGLINQPSLKSALNLEEQTGPVLLLTHFAAVAVVAVLILALVRLVGSRHESQLLLRGLTTLLVAVRTVFRGRQDGGR